MFQNQLRKKATKKSLCKRFVSMDFKKKLSVLLIILVSILCAQCLILLWLHNYRVSKPEGFIKQEAAQYNNTINNDRISKREGDIIQTVKQQNPPEIQYPQTSQSHATSRPRNETSQQNETSQSRNETSQQNETSQAHVTWLPRNDTLQLINNTANMNLTEPLFEIDIVYTWINGSMKGDTKNYQPKTSAFEAGEHRFREWDELRYSLRSIWMYAPWHSCRIRKIYILSYRGLWPTWIDREYAEKNGLIVVIDQQTLFDDPTKPSFNSLAIETVLHRIPNLSRFFWFFNNDVFLGRPVQLEDLFDVEKGCPVHYVDLPVPPVIKLNSAYNKFLKFNLNLLKDRFNITVKRIMPHIAGLYDRDLFRWMETELHDVVVQTRSHMFRSPNGQDVFLLYLHGYLFEVFHKHPYPWTPKRVYLPEMGNKKAGQYYEFMILKGSTEEKDFKFYTDRIRELRPRFVCINDDVSINTIRDAKSRKPRNTLERIRNNFKKMMQTLWPDPAPWELPMRMNE